MITLDINVDELTYFYIRIENGLPLGLPVRAMDMFVINPNVDLSSVPDGWALYKKTKAPTKTIRENFPTLSLQVIGNTVVEVWTTFLLDHDALVKVESEIEIVKSYWAEHGDLTWVFNESTGVFNPPL